MTRSQQALVVDADPETRRFCRVVLEQSGFIVRETDTGVAAVVAARESVPDAILLGLQLRDVIGREAMGWLEANPALHRTLFVTLNGWPAEDGASTRRKRPTEIGRAHV